MNQEENAVVRKFMKDVYTSDVVCRSIKESFLKDDGNKDINYLAAKMIAVNLLNTAFTDMARLKQGGTEHKRTQAGL